MGIRVKRSPLMVSIGILGLTGVAVLWGRVGSPSRALATPPAPQQVAAEPRAEATSATQGADYSKQAVAYIFDTVQITREELGEYLIARFGAERLNNFVNRRIIEIAAQKQGITVTEAEVEAGFEDGIPQGPANVTKVWTSSKRCWKPYGKNLYEMEGRCNPGPRIMLRGKLCRDPRRGNRQGFYRRL